MKWHEPPWVLSEMKVEVTHRCTLGCIHWSSDAAPDNDQEMAEGDCMRIINQAIAMKVREITFSGGEPLLWDSLIDAVDLTTRSGADAIIYTSGNVDNINKSLRALKKGRVKRIIFSIFGASSISHDKITCSKGSFKQTIRATKLAKKLGFITEFHFVPLSINYKELLDIGIIAHDISVSRISILRFVPHGRGQLIEDYALNQLQNHELKRIIIDMRKQNIDIRAGSPYNILMLNTHPKCCAGIDRLIVGPDLRIYPCDAFKQIKAEEVVDTLQFSTLSTHDLHVCWSKSPFLNAVREYLTSAFEEPCVSCERIEECLSGCLAQKVIKSGDLRKQADPMCMSGKGLLT